MFISIFGSLPFDPLLLHPRDGIIIVIAITNVIKLEYILFKSLIPSIDGSSILRQILEAIIFVF